MILSGRGRRIPGHQVHRMVDTLSCPGSIRFDREWSHQAAGWPRRIVVSSDSVVSRVLAKEESESG